MSLSARGDALQSTLYDQLRHAASCLFRRERHDGLLQPTALLHEAYLRLARTSLDPLSRTRFVAAAVGEMRRVLIDHARGRRAVKRGGQRERLLLDTRALALPRATIDLTELHDAIER
ncbi:MAG: RNA polymerase subunit sigma-70, partial [Phycisphaerae bacterium]|nr:RNA polymerase subunit sigma-70 [Phycisphaerae bacterium]